ncbi:UDP-glucose:undecaprenyl-phosphate glucose-1-phosphate transferase [Stieleria maiorica]|uniref:UDP-glucose:undecaprenyl-phosphate glucose-1-phosphate transferase n=1 Tax=Stieleria maiorica TaxID=2795974 RepID=A0A5B9MLZ7_9BACT|nr:sugar transferase [Stieleria maiorica]QEG01041.1 UDP-glucose:undecaprenyl-phosphate glucose-1-phosphate transferase [Stieleria maiorica]
MNATIKQPSNVSPVRVGVATAPPNGAGGKIDAASLQKLGTSAALALGRRQAWYDFRSTAPLLVFDVLAAGLAVSLATIIHRLNGGTPHLTFCVGVVLLVLLMHRIHGLYPACGASYSDEFRGIMRTCIVVTVGSAFGLLMGSSLHAFPWLCWGTLSTTLFVSLAAVRPVARRLLSEFDWWTQPVVIVGNGSASRRLYERLDRSRHEGLRPAGIIFDPTRHWDGVPAVNESESKLVGTPLHEQPGGQFYRIDSPEELRRPSGDTNGRSVSHGAPVRRSESCWLGPTTELESILHGTGACRLALAEQDAGQWQDYHAFHGIPHVMLPMDFSYHPTESVRLAERGEAIELHCYTALTSPHAQLAKRVIDLALVLLTLPFWLPLMAGIAIAIKIFDPGPVFYYQDRVGRFRTPFRAIKFRSMVCDADRRLREYLEQNPQMMKEWKRTHKLQKDPRVTKIGNFLRKTSLDELPQLFNVLLGEMSLVGPRPIIDSGDYDREYIQDYPEVFELYQMVRPGITGLWQVSGRNSTTYTQRVFMDRFYLHNWSIGLDIFILWRTVKTALFREGAC